MPLLYERYDPVTGRNTEIETDAEAGLVFTHTQDTRPVVEACKRAASNFDPNAWRKLGWTRVASVPAVIVRQLMREGIWQDPKRRTEWLNGRDQRVFRTDDGRKL
jgi:hypothetical protein